MSDDSAPLGTALLLGGVMGFVFGVALMGLCPPSYADGVKETQDKAIEAGVGRWDVDPKTGKTTFVFNGQPAEKKP